MKSLLTTACASLLLFAPAVLSAQIVVIHPPAHRPIRPVPEPAQYEVRSFDVHVSIRDQVANVQMDQVFKNESGATLEAQILFPVADTAAVSGLTLLVDGKELPGRILEKDEARRIYENIVRSQKDPALLEYVSHGLFRTSVFPVPANSERKVQLRYSQLLAADHGLVDFKLPLGTARHANKPIETVNINVRIESAEPIKAVYSPTHNVNIERPDETHAACKLTLNDVRGSDDLRLLYGTEKGLVGANLVTYKPDGGEEGYFLLLASPEVDATEADQVEKTVVFVVDRSGSMSGTKIEQAVSALKFLIERLKPGDTFNIVAYDSTVESFRRELQRADEDTIGKALGFADGIHAGGSTNIDAALQTALGMLSDTTRPSYVLFLTDGLPTTGEQNEMKIAENADNANQADARLFSFGVGFDVNSRLLDRLSREQGGRSVYVRPNESIEAHVSALYSKIGSPLLTDVDVQFEFDGADDATAPISRVYPRELGDLFEGDQLVVIGRYSRSGAAKIELTGSLAGEKKTFTFSGEFAAKSIDDSNAFVEKLWATRRIGEIIDELDLKGRNEELIDELVQLSTRHGILTPYTSFLADENVELSAAGNADRASEVANVELGRVTGEAGFAQRQFKGQLQQANQIAGGGFGGQMVPNAEGRMERVETVRNVGSKTFFRKKERWQDSTVTPKQEENVVRVEQYSREYFDLAARDGGRFARYLAFDEPVVINLDGQTYQIDPAETDDGSDG